MPDKKHPIRGDLLRCRIGAGRPARLPARAERYLTLAVNVSRVLDEIEADGRFGNVVDREDARSAADGLLSASRILWLAARNELEGGSKPAGRRGRGRQ